MVETPEIPEACAHCARYLEVDVGAVGACVDCRDPLCGEHIRLLGDEQIETCDDCFDYVWLERFAPGWRPVENAVTSL